MKNFRAPLIRSLREAGFSTVMTWGTRTTFTHVRQNGQRRVKLWFARDVFDASRAQQLKLERALKANYGKAYLGGYFIEGALDPSIVGPNPNRSLCIVLDTEEL
jgi:hypothetical protein